MHRTTITQARELLNSKKLSSLQLTEAIFARIDAVEDQVKAFTYLMREKAIEQANTQFQEFFDPIEYPTIPSVEKA